MKRTSFMAIALSIALAAGCAQAAPAQDASMQTAKPHPAAIPDATPPRDALIERDGANPERANDNITLTLTSLVHNLIQSEHNTDDKFANLIQVLMLCAIALTTLTGIGFLGLLWLLRAYMKHWALRQLKDSFREIQLMTTAANADFVSALEAYSSQQLADKVPKLNEELAASPNLSVAGILQAVIELTFQPLRLRDDILAIAYRDEPVNRQISRVYSLWAEVKADNVSVRVTQKLVRALLPLVMEKSGSSSRVIRALKAFDRQLLDVSEKGTPLPEMPGF